MVQLTHLLASYKIILIKYLIKIKDLFTFNLWRHNILHSCLDKKIKQQNNFIDIIYQDEGLYFKSIKGTLNHILAADILFYMRIFSKKEIMINNQNFDIFDISKLWTTGNFENFINPDSDKISYLQKIKILQATTLESYLNQIELRIENRNLSFFNEQFTYNDTNGKMQIRPRNLSFIHAINHTTHHIGQITSVLSKYSKQDFPEMDLSYFIEQNMKKI